MIEEKDLTEIGIFRKPHGLRGELNASLWLPVDDIDENNPLIIGIDGIFVPFFIETIRRKGSEGALIKLEHTDADDAVTFVNKTIYMLTSSLPDDLTGEDGEGAYAEDLVGYTLTDTLSDYKGVITDIDLSTENALFIVTTDRGEDMIPVADDLIESIDDETKTVMMSLPPGLLDINTKKEKQDV